MKLMNMHKKSYFKRSVTGVINSLVFSLTAATALATPPTLQEFQTGDPARASEVNDNFSKLKTYAHGLANSLTPVLCTGANKALQWDGSSWSCATITASGSSISCPTGYVPVPGNITLGTSDFCVAQFEMKSDGSGNAVSQNTGTPWTNINANDAFSECSSILGGSGEYALISNPEWMTIARNIEATATNWSGSAVGSGMLPRGHSDGGSVSAVADTNDPYTGTGNNSGQSPGSGWEQKREFFLSNNSKIWDFAGNTWEWVDYSVGENPAVYSSGPTNCPSSYHEMNVAIPGGCSASSTDILPAGGSYTANTNGVGRWYGGSQGGVKRGGANGSSTGAGVFTLEFADLPTNTNSNYGFRCVYRP